MPQPTQPQEIKLAEKKPGAEYANAQQVSNTKEEFLLMFASITGLTGRVVGKIITSPGHCKRIINALQQNLKMYEDKFGAIQEAAAPTDKEIGFSDK
ncbi:DUF3467 domain-containing protein [Candidatus Falkowbacteria bacterium]|nr:DUF3467 domain-containing protein [Candidatus Falkowbacteria bacterium]